MSQERPCDGTGASERGVKGGIQSCRGQTGVEAVTSH